MRLGVLGEEVHGKVDVLELAALGWHIARPGGTNSKNEGVVSGAHFLEVKGGVGANVCASDKLNTLRSEQVYTTLHSVLVELHVGDSVHEKTTNAVLALKDGHVVSLAVEHVSTREACWAGS